MKICVVVLYLAAVALAKHEVYQGYKSYYVSVESREQQQALGPLTEQFEVDVLSHPLVQREGVALVAPQHQRGFTQALLEAGIQHRIHRDDVKAALEYDDVLIEQQKVRTRASNGGRSLPYDNYQEIEVINEYIEDLASRYPDVVTLVTPATSSEGRPIRYLKISTTNFQDESKPVIFIDAGIHAREWISPPTVTWAMHKLVEDITENDLANNFDWILLPVVNPDGYAYTFTDSRFWRKTRSTTPPNTESCPGVDGNRNYDFAWNTAGTSPNICSDTYAGSEAFSEPETRVVRDILMEYRERIPLYITMHSYGSMILYPWGNDGTFSWNLFPLHRVGLAQAEAMDSLQPESFPSYVVGNSVSVIGYPAAGAAEDYAHSIGIPLAYTYELPGLVGGLNGFHLDPQWIERVVQETWAGVVAGVRAAGVMYNAGK